MAEQVNTEEPQQPQQITEDPLVAALVHDETPDPEAAPAEPEPAAPQTEAQTPEVVEADAEEGTADQPADEAQPEASEDEPVATEEPEAPAQQPGTPNKALQRSQMRQSEIERKLDTLLARIETQGAATPQQATQAATLQEQAQKVADEIEALAADGYELDPFTDTKKVVKRVASQEHRIAQLEAQLRETQANTQWQKVEAKYPGVDVRTLWQQAAERAQKLGYQGDAGTRRANEFFHDLAAAALPKPKAEPAKTAITPSPKAPVPTAQTTARKAPPVTSGGASVAVKSGGQVRRPAPASDESVLDSLASKLVR